MDLAQWPQVFPPAEMVEADKKELLFGSDRLKKTSLASEKKPLRQQKILAPSFG